MNEDLQNRIARVLCTADDDECNYGLMAKAVIDELGLHYKTEKEYAQKGIGEFIDEDGELIISTPGERRVEGRWESGWE